MKSLTQKDVMFRQTEIAITVCLNLTILIGFIALSSSFSARPVLITVMYMLNEMVPMIWLFFALGKAVLIKKTPFLLFNLSIIDAAALIIFKDMHLVAINQITGWDIFFVCSIMLLAGSIAVYFQHLRNEVKKY